MGSGSVLFLYQCGVVIITPAWALVSVTVSELEAIMIAVTMAIVAVL